MAVDTEELKNRIAEKSAWVPLVRNELHRVLVGQEGLVDRMFVALLTNGHILLEGVPGLAKTLTVKALAGTMSVSSSGTSSTRAGRRPAYSPSTCTCTRRSLGA